MKKIAILTNIRSPYKTLQINEFVKIKNATISVYYTQANNNAILWEKHASKFKEIELNTSLFYKKNDIFINKGLKRLVKENDIIIIGGYSELSYIVTSIFCKIYNKPYIIFIDGISKFKIYEVENKFKFFIKKQVVKNSHYIMANGNIAQKYLVEKMDYRIDKIYNQFLTVDTKTINELYEDKETYRREYRKKYNIDLRKKVVIYSGRLIEIKNIKSVIKAISFIKTKDNIVLFITGGGKLEPEMLELAQTLGVNIFITGFIKEQEELFRHYYLGDILILPSIEEPWGLVVNEAMCSGLPVLVSDIAGCCEDLVKDNINGFLINPFDKNDIKEKIEIILYQRDLIQMGYESRKIIEKWKFENSRKNLEKILLKLKLNNNERNK